MLSVFVSQDIYLASLGGDGKVKDNVYRMMFAVMTNEAGRTFNWSGKHGWMGDAEIKRTKLQGTTSVAVGTQRRLRSIETRAHLVIPSSLIQTSLFNNNFSDVEVSSDEDVINSSVPVKGEAL